MNLKKILIIAAILIALGGIVAFSIIRSQSGVTKVFLGKAANEELTSIVSGTGQIKPKTYVNVGATAFGRITHLYVKEGDHVRKGEVVATVENVQPQANVAAQQAAIASNRAAENTAVANLEESQADLQQKKLDYQRARLLYHAQLIAKQDFDAKKAAYDVAVATIAQRKAAVAQSAAQTNQAIATQRSNYDSLDKTISRAPFDALVTNVPVREGETVVVGIQNAEGSTLMTLADMSVITAEVKVDETDIVNVSLGQQANVTVDALPGKIFKGHVTEVGDQALLRTTGIATSQSTTGTEEAKDFKVVITLDNPSDELRPGLSATAKIVTAHKPNALAIPIQALTLRDPNSLKEAPTNAPAASATSAKSQPVQGVFVVRDKNGKLISQFVPVQTGITGTTDIEVTSGLKAGDQIITGPYTALRTLKNGARVKRDTTPMNVNADSSS